MSLAETLTKIKEASAKRVPPEAAAVMADSVAKLRESGILDRTIKVGDALPGFELESARGDMVSSAGLLAKGAVVLTVFRGHW